MANLIPGEAKKIVMREYRLRVAAVWLFLLAVGCVIVSILMAPTYLLIDAQGRALAARSNDVQVTQDEFTKASAQVVESNKTAQYLRRENGAVSLTSLIEDIEALAGSSIVVWEYRFIRNEEESRALTIGGTAVDRTSLAAFRDALAANEQFAEVELPLANLAGDRDIPFSIQVVLTNDE